MNERRDSNYVNRGETKKSPKLKLFCICNNLVAGDESGAGNPLLAAPGKTTEWSIAQKAVALPYNGIATLVLVRFNH
jgi:hypothetical protein